MHKSCTLKTFYCKREIKLTNVSADDGQRAETFVNLTSVYNTIFQSADLFCFQQTLQYVIFFPTLTTLHTSFSQHITVSKNPLQKKCNQFDMFKFPVDQSYEDVEPVPDYIVVEESALLHPNSPSSRHTSPQSRKKAKTKTKTARIMMMLKSLLTSTVMIMMTWGKRRKSTVALPTAKTHEKVQKPATIFPTKSYLTLFKQSKY